MNRVKRRNLSHKLLRNRNRVSSNYQNPQRHQMLNQVEPNHLKSRDWSNHLHRGLSNLQLVYRSRAQDSSRYKVFKNHQIVMEFPSHLWRPSQWRTFNKRRSSNKWKAMNSAISNHQRLKKLWNRKASNWFPHSIWRSSSPLKEPTVCTSAAKTLVVPEL